MGPPEMCPPCILLELYAINPRPQVQEINMLQAGRSPSTTAQLISALLCMCLCVCPSFNPPRSWLHQYLKPCRCQQLPFYIKTLSETKVKIRAMFKGLSVCVTCICDLFLSQTETRRSAENFTNHKQDPVNCCFTQLLTSLTTLTFHTVAFLTGTLWHTSGITS